MTTPFNFSKHSRREQEMPMRVKQELGSEVYTRDGKDEVHTYVMEETPEITPASNKLRAVADATRVSRKRKK